MRRRTGSSKETSKMERRAKQRENVDDADIDVVGENTILLPRRTVSLCIVMSLMIAFMAIAIAVATFTPTYVQCNKTTQDLAMRLRGSIISDLTARIEDFFSAPLRTTLTITAQLNANLFIPGSLAENQSIGFVADMLLADTTGSSQQTYLWIPQANIAYTALTSLVAPEPGTIFVTKLVSAAGPFNSYRMNVSTRVVDFSTPVLTLPLSGPLLYFFPTFQNGLKIPKGQLWGTPAAAYSEMHFPTGYLFKDSLGRAGSLGASVKPSKTSEMLAQLKMGPSARAVLVHVATTWVFGNSWGEAVSILNTTVIRKAGNVTLQQFQDLTATDAIRMRFLRLIDLQDPLIQQVLAKYSVSFLLSVQTPFSIKYGTDVAEIALDVVSISDNYGLQLRVIIVEPIRDFVGDLYTTRNAVAGIVFGAVVVVIIFGAAFSIIVSNPMKMLGIRLQLQAHFQDVADDHDDESVLTEVAAVQDSFAAMKNELDRAKRYLPESVVARRREHDDDEDGDSPSPAASKDDSDDLSASASSAFSDNPASPPSSVKLRRGSRIVCNKLNIDRFLSKRCVTIAVFNTAHWHSTIVGMSPQECMDYHAEYLRDVLGAIATHRGSVDFFQGDHVVASFNAIKNVRKHAQCATLAALAAVEALQNNAPCAHRMPALHVGISTGLAMCGNAGTETMSRFTLSGPAYTDACRLERYSRNGPATHVLISDAVEQSIAGALTVEAIDLISFSTVNSLAQSESAPSTSGAMLRAVYKAHPNLRDGDSSQISSTADATSVVMPYSVSRTEQDDLFLCVNACFQLIASTLSNQAPSASPTLSKTNSGGYSTMDRGAAGGRVELLSELRRRLGEVDHCSVTSVGRSNLEAMMEYAANDESRVAEYFVSGRGRR